MNAEAKIQVVDSIKVVGHPCKACELNPPPIIFKGVVENFIKWPVVFGYQISYCPHCGLKLPLRYGKDK